MKYDEEFKKKCTKGLGVLWYIFQFRQEILDALVILKIFWKLTATANDFDFRFKSYISIGLLQGIQTLVRLPPIYLEQFTV